MSKPIGRTTFGPGFDPVQEKLQRATELAQTCADQAHFTVDREVARELWRMALEYQREVALLNGGQIPDIGPAPHWFK